MDHKALMSGETFTVKENGQHDNKVDTEQEKRVKKQKLKKEGGRGGVIQKRMKIQKKEKEMVFCKS